MQTCRHCGACRRRCPDTERCLSAVTQKKGVLSDEDRAYILKWKSAWGCDICQLVCPENKGAALSPISFFYENRLPDPTSDDIRDELVAVRDEVMAVLETEMLRETDDTVYAALVSARTAVFEVLTERAEGESRLVTVVPADVTPALVLAYDWHDDAGRDFEIAARNGVVREGFCPAVETRVLSE